MPSEPPQTGSDEMGLLGWQGELVPGRARRGDGIAPSRIQGHRAAFADRSFRIQRSPQPPHLGCGWSPTRWWAFQEGLGEHSGAQGNPNTKPGRALSLAPQHPGWAPQTPARCSNNCVLHCSWKTMSTSLWTLKTSAFRPPCHPARGCWRPWRPFTALPPMTGPGTGRYWAQGDLAVGPVMAGQSLSP